MRTNIIQQLWELKHEPAASDTNDEQVVVVDRYQEVLGQRGNFTLHAFVAVLSFLVFGLVPPVVYGFSFRQSDDKDLKLAAVAAASLLCIVLLSFAKAYTQSQNPSDCIKTVTYYVVVGFGVSGASYLVGDLIHKLMEKLNWFEYSSSTPAHVTLPLAEMGIRAWESY